MGWSFVTDRSSPSRRLDHVANRLSDEVGLVEVNLVIALRRDHESSARRHAGKVRLPLVQDWIRAETTSHDDQRKVPEHVWGGQPGFAKRDEFLTPGFRSD